MSTTDHLEIIRSVRFEMENLDRIIETFDTIKEKRKKSKKSFDKKFSRLEFRDFLVRSFWRMKINTRRRKMFASIDHQEIIQSVRLELENLDRIILLCSAKPKKIKKQFPLLPEWFFDSFIPTSSTGPH